MGAYFGYAVASGDIDGDGLDDLIVGAPMYTVPDNPEMTIETGRVYVIYQGAGPEKFRKVDTRYSTTIILKRYTVSRFEEKYCYRITRN